MSRILLQRILKVLKVKRLRLDEHLIPIIVEEIEAELAKPEQEFYPDWDMLKPYHERIAELETQLAKPESHIVKWSIPVDPNNFGEPLAQPEQEPVSHLWECIGRWSAYLAANGKQGNLAPPTWLVDAVKAATAPPKPEQEPVAQIRIKNGHWIDTPRSAKVKSLPDGLHDLYTAPPKQEIEQEPVVEVQSFGKKQVFVVLKPLSDGDKLYTAPPRKEWVGLTEHEIWECQKPGLSDDVYKLIEAKLRERNT
jgi:hypothetical protein